MLYRTSQPLFGLLLHLTYSPPPPPVYPETKGVPLEEMDAVFGEASDEENIKLPTAEAAEPLLPAETREMAYPPIAGAKTSWLGKLNGRDTASYEPLAGDDDVREAEQYEVGEGRGHLRED